MKPTTELLHQLKSAAQEEIMCRKASDTSDAWQDLASPENILALIEIALPVLEQQGGWISCSKRMPAIGERVLIPSTTGRNTLEAIRFESNKFNRFGVEVIADYWMPMPAPTQPSTNPQIENDGWIEWGGGDCPLPMGCKVEIRTRIGGLRRDLPAHRWGWEHLNDFDDIIAYRVIENDGREG